MRRENSGCVCPSRYSFHFSSKYPRFVVISIPRCKYVIYCKNEMARFEKRSLKREIYFGSSLGFVDDVTARSEVLAFHRPVVVQPHCAFCFTLKLQGREPLPPLSREKKTLGAATCCFADRFPSRDVRGEIGIRKKVSSLRT